MLEISFCCKPSVCQGISQLNFHAMEVAETPDVTVENDILESTQDVLEQKYAMEEIVFHDAKETVEDIVQILSVLEEDILETVTGTEKNFEALTVREEDLLKTATTTEKDIQFVKADENISGSPSGRDNKTVKSFEKVGTRKKVCWEFGKKKMFSKVSNTGEIIKCSDGSNQISVNEIVEKINISELLSQYTEYERNSINNLKQLYDSRNIMNEYLEDNSCIAQRYQFAITDADLTPDVSSISERELKTMNRFLLAKARVSIECLRLLCWNLDGVNSKIRQNKKLNTTINMKTDKFVNYIFTNGKKQD